jgi:hypothetical protein
MGDYNNFFEETSIEIKHFDTLWNDENLQWGMYGFNQERYFKDKTTDFFTKVFLADDKTRFMFVDYVYHILLSELNLKINKLLKELYNIYLFKNEFFTLLFKGGNVMNLYYGNLKNQIAEYKKDCQYNFYNGFVIDNVSNFLNDLDNNFQISDVDFSMYIGCFDYMKYLKITHCAKIIISATLTKISSNFDEYFNLIINDNYHQEPTTSNTINDTIYDVAEQEEKFRIFQNQLNKNITGINEINFGNLFTISITKFNKAHQLIKLYLTFEKIAIRHGINLDSKLSELETKLTIIMDDKLKNLFKNKFYTNDKIADFKSKIKTFYLGENFCVKFKDDYKNQAHSVHIYVYEGNQEVEPLLEKRKNAIVHSGKNLNESVNVINTEPEFLHYITYNTSILKLRSSGVSDFDLFRIKFNVKIQNVIKEYVLEEDYDKFVDELSKYQRNRDIENERDSTNKKLFLSREEWDAFISGNGFKLVQVKKLNFNIPSEFIDISLPAFQDLTAQHFIKKNGNQKVSNIYKIVDGTFLYTDCYSKIEIYDDLNIVIFSQNTYFPWVDKKYDKRIRRLIALLVIANLVFANGKYTLEPDTRTILKNLIYTCVIIYNSLTADKDYNMDFNNIKKYIVPDSSINYVDVEVVAFIVNTIDVNNELVDYRSIFKINEKYSSLKYLLNLIFIFYKLFSNKSDSNNKNIVRFLNAYRTEQLWEPFDEADSNNIVAELKKKYIKLLKTIIDNGQVFLLIF